MKKIIDLRSDTVTKPTDEMRKAMWSAEVGDDGKRDDPTVNQLQDLATEILSMDASLFVPSGTMGNLISILVHTHPGEELILDNLSHIYNNELAGFARLGGVSVKCLDCINGMMKPEQIRDAMDPGVKHSPKSSLLCLENTHNGSGGIALSTSEVESMASIAREKGIAIHLDGARLFNAAVARGIHISDYSDSVDSVMVCLSKGLSAPVGSILSGSFDFIDRARQTRKLLGGTMRQAGIVAAAGIVALKTMVKRLEEDHYNAMWLGERLSQINCYQQVNPSKFNTNILHVKIDNRIGDLVTIAERLSDSNILVAPERGYLRLVTHRGIDESDLEYILKIFAQIAKEANTMVS